MTKNHLNTQFDLITMNLFLGGSIWDENEEIESNFIQILVVYRSHVKKCIIISSSFRNTNRWNVELSSNKSLNCFSNLSGWMGAFHFEMKIILQSLECWNCNNINLINFAKFKNCSQCLFACDLIDSINKLELFLTFRNFFFTFFLGMEKNDWKILLGKIVKINAKKWYHSMLMNLHDNFFDCSQYFTTFLIHKILYKIERKNFTFSFEDFSCNIWWMLNVVYRIFSSLLLPVDTFPVSTHQIFWLWREKYEKYHEDCSQRKLMYQNPISIIS